ncbi:hypothetical protein SCLCIDRAFT_15402 [Scleroderma citrinum Foug A]|uniref:Uncharacterized protein n=1 Tax=Scleroderma citrinum Foug A TaxID=1036808 RepID=A0A0C2ZQR7_9AGAM|nr:hypothetical protein SCLCIDRAFT_15402 [Scleroderma citrinum Foug A]
MSDVVYFMSVGVSLAPAPGSSFEEIRTQDYLNAYIATGRPPVPCPPTPEDLAARAALGLPPLFTPLAAPNTEGVTNGVSRTPADLPQIHAFDPFKSMGESYQCISAQPLYSHFSHEELRHHAYRSGNKTAPTPTSNASTAPTFPFYANDSPSTAYMTSTVTPGSPELFMSITASPPHDKQSFEELRVEYLTAPKQQPLGTKISEPLFGRPRGDAFSVPQPSPLRLF